MIQDCFDQHPLVLADNPRSHQFYVPLDSPKITKFNYKGRAIFFFYKIWVIFVTGVRFTKQRNRGIYYDLWPPEKSFPSLNLDKNSSLRFAVFFSVISQGPILNSERILNTIKQRNNNFIMNILVFLLNNFIWTNKSEETKLYFLPNGGNKVVHQESKNILAEIVVSLLNCF